MRGATRARTLRVPRKRAKRKAGKRVSSSRLHGQFFPGFRRLRVFDGHGVTLEEVLVELLVRLKTPGVGPRAPDGATASPQRGDTPLRGFRDEHQMHAVARLDWPLPLAARQCAQLHGERLAELFHDLAGRELYKCVLQQKWVTELGNVSLVAGLMQPHEQLRGVLCQALAVTLRVEISLTEGEARHAAKRLRVFPQIAV